MLAPTKLVQWLKEHEHADKVYGHVYNYHPRSDAHSIALCTFILEDILNDCPQLRRAALADHLVYGINLPHLWPGSGKRKTIDLAIAQSKGAPAGERFAGAIRKALPADIGRVVMSCEAKTVMTEHSKSQPRIFDELGSSHEIVHQGDREAIAAGITVVNIAETFVSPLRQRSRELTLSRHNQPRAAERMINHLRGLPIRNDVLDAGFDAYATIVIECDNQGTVQLWSDAPAPQVGDDDHYKTFLDRLTEAYLYRFAK